jgi:hypothetical protein
MISDGYGLEPEEVEIAVRWLQLNHPEEPIGLPKVLKLGKHGGARKEKSADEQADRVSLKHGNSSDYLAARLERDSPETLAAFHRGEHKSVKAAARAAKIIPPKLPSSSRS